MTSLLTNCYPIKNRGIAYQRTSESSNCIVNALTAEGSKLKGVVYKVTHSSLVQQLTS